MESSVQRLINNLKKLSQEDETYLFLEEDLDTHSFWFNETTDAFRKNASDTMKKLSDEIMVDLDEWLIADNGHHHVPNRETLNRFGFRFEKGESDAFGPLSSVIVLPAKENQICSSFRIVYG